MRARRSHGLDVLLAAAAATALSIEGFGRGADPQAVILPLAAVACAPLVWRRRAPVAVLLAVAVGLVVCLLTFHPYDTAIYVAAVALYSVALLGDRRRSLLVGVAWTAFLVALVLMISPDADRAEAGYMVLLAFAALAAGETVRSRRALRAAAVEREAEREREQAREHQRRIAEERLRLARELHDTVAHALVAINVRAGVAAHLAGENDPDGALADIMSVSAQALEELRGTLGLLRDPGSPAPTGPGVPGLTAATLAPLLERPRAAGLRVEDDIEFDAGAVPLDVQQAAYRIVQEALTNTMRHSTATAVRVSVGARDGTLTIEIADDGAATAPAAPGHGLQGMEERAGTFGGEVSAGPDDKGGWTVRATLPLAPTA